MMQTFKCVSHYLGLAAVSVHGDWESSMTMNSGIAHMDVGEIPLLWKKSCTNKRIQVIQLCDNMQYSHRNRVHKLCSTVTTEANINIPSSPLCIHTEK